MPDVVFTIAGDPVPKGRPKFGNGRAYTPKRTVDAETAVGWAAKQSIKAPFDGPIRVDLVFKTKTKRRVDLDNLTKLVLDGLNGVAWNDDSQIVRLSAEKFHVPDGPVTWVRVIDLG